MAKRKKYAEDNLESKRLEQKRLEKEEKALLDDGRTPLVRKIAKNIDQLMIVSSIREPDIAPGLIDRFLILASLEELIPFICIAKADLGEDFEINQWVDLYKNMSINVIVTSAVEDRGIEKLKKSLMGRRTALAGHSGVGKSTLLNKIDPSLKIETGSVRLTTGRGKHITRRVKMYRLNEDTYVFDLPGIKLIDFPDLRPIDVAQRFPDFTEYEQQCRFANCTHLSEPKCAVKEAVEEKKISEDRYNSYKRIVAELAD